MLATVDSVVGTPTTSRRPSGAWRVVKLAIGIGFYLALWQLAGERQWLGRTFPPLTDIVSETFGAARRDAIGRAFSATASATAIGFVIGVTAALAGAVVSSVVPVLRRGIDNLATILHAMPVIALAPLFIVTLGRERTPVAIAALAAGFAMFVAATAAVESARGVHHDVFTALGASRLRRFRSLQLPAAIPGFADGLRLAAPAAVLGAVLGEWFGAPRGLGVLIVSAMQNYQIELLWSAALLAAVLSMAAFGLFTLLARWAATRVELVTVAVTELDVRSIPIVGRDTDGVVAPPATPSVARPWPPLRWLRSAVSQWWTVLAVLVAWQLWLGFTGFNSIVLPRPSDVVSDLVGHPGAYAGDTARTIGLALVGVAVGMTLGFAIAVTTWASSLAAGAIGPLVLMLRSIPIVAVIPVVARVVGYGDKIVPIVTIMLAFFPAYVMTTSGLRAAPPTAVDLMLALGASRWTLLRRVLVPSALPNLLVALRLCASSAVLAAMVAEFLAGTSGLGRLFSNSRVRFDNERAWGAAVIATALSVAFFQIALRLERWGRARFR